MLRIGLAYSLKPDDPGADDGPDDRFEEFDRPETIEALAEAIRADGHDVTLLGDGREFLAKMLADPTDFVFNIAEGQGARRDREARVPAVCEMLNVPYSGSDPLTLAVCLDKNIATSVVADLGSCMVPGSLAIAPDASEAEVVRVLDEMIAKAPDPYVILKPSFEGSSKGIRGTCVTDSVEEALAIYRRLAADYAQPILVEEFLDGDELTVGVIGNGNEAEVIGIMRVVPKVATERFVYSLEVKRDWRNRVSYETPARLQSESEAALRAMALRAYRTLGCRDVTRIDFRMWEDSPYFIEANPLPGLSPGTSDLVILAEGYGISHGDLVRRILRTALARVGLGDRGSICA